MYVAAYHQPPDWRFHTVARGYENWTAETEFLARISEQEDVHYWHRTGSKRHQRPKPYRRPWVKDVHLDSAALRSKGLFQNGILGTPVEYDDARARLVALNGRAPDDEHYTPVEPAQVEPSDAIADELEKQLEQARRGGRFTAELLGYPYPEPLFP